MNFDLSLAPGETKAVNVAGDYFAIVFCTVDVLVRINGQESDIYSQGDSFELPPNETFKRLEIRNPSATATCIVLLYAGFGRYVQRRVSVVEPVTEVRGWSGSSLAGGAFQDFPGLPSGNLFRRKCIQVTNEDANLNIQLRDAAGNVVLVIFHETSITLPISGFVRLHNQNGAPVACRFSEIFWST